MSESTVARIAGNLLSGQKFNIRPDEEVNLIKQAVARARSIVAEVERTKPRPESEPFQ